MADYSPEHGPWLRVVRSYLGLSQKQCAEMLNVSLRSLQSMESGRAEVPSGIISDMTEYVLTMEKLAGRYAVSQTANVRGRSVLEVRAIGQALRMNPSLRIQP